MKELSFEKMEVIEGGVEAVLCGAALLGVALCAGAVIATDGLALFFNGLGFYGSLMGLSACIE